MTDLQELQRRLGFAGSRDAVRAYQADYVRWFAPGARVVDIGCGEGVFLDLLREQGRHAVGVDASPSEVALARARGHEVHEDDAVAFLRAHPGGFDGVFCAHVIEHLPPAAAVAFLDAARAALAPGGVLALITPDPADLEVWTERFWLDLTHVRPYPRVLLVAMLEALGFTMLASGNDPNSARGSSWRGAPKRWWRRLRFGPHGYRGDTFVVARR